MYELVTGAALLNAGNMGHVLVIGAETLSKVVDPHDRGTCILFGDAAAGVVLEPSPDDGPGLLAFDLGCDGSATNLLGIPAGGSRLPATPDTIEEGLQYIKMQGQEVFRRAVRTVVESAGIALERAGLTPADVDWFIPHQANARIIEAAANRLGVSARRPSSTSTSTATLRPRRFRSPWPRPPTTGASSDGDLILMSGFGAGMTWGSAVLSWGRA